MWKVDASTGLLFQIIERKGGLVCKWGEEIDDDHLIFIFAYNTKKCIDGKS